MLLAHLQPLRTIMLEEAYRGVSLSNGEQMPLIRAVVRSLGKLAATGSPQAQKIFLNSLKSIEGEMAALGSANFERALDYRARCDAQRRHCAEAGLPEPRFLVNPDDMQLNWETLTVEFHGPVTADGAARLESAIAKRQECSDAIDRLLAERNGNPDEMALGLALREQVQFDALNVALPQRYQTELSRRVTDEDIQRVKDWLAKRSSTSNPDIAE